MNNTTKSYSLNIELLPEFGWSIKDQPVYGPGSVFQGFVNLTLNVMIPVERVRIAFYATETIPPFDPAPGSIRVAKKTLFSIQQVLWDSKQNQKHLDLDSKHVFPFTVQMPMVQFPPSCDHQAYKCNFQLIALLDTPSLPQTSIKTEVPVVCMPFVETSLLKTTMSICAEKNNLSVKVEMGAQEFVPGDVIPVSLHVVKQASKRSSSLEYVTITMKLVQKMKFVYFNDMQDVEKTITSAKHKVILINGAYCDADPTLKISSDITPSYNYGDLVNTSYKLQISIEQKGPMGGIWSHCVEVDNIDITIGTLGYGIRSSNELRLYSEYNDSSSTMPLPKFMKAIEYEDALPLYDAAKLPAYENCPTFAQAMVGY